MVDIKAEEGGGRSAGLQGEFHLAISSGLRRVRNLPLR